MARARTATSIIWRTVVCAGAMLAPACGPGPAAPATTPRAEAEPAPEPVPTAPPDPPPAVAEAAPPAEPVVEEPPAEAEPPAAPAHVQVTITSKPAGASVYRGKALLGKTPLIILVDPAEGEVTVRLVHAGHKEQTRTIPVDGDQTVAITLQKKPAADPPQDDLGTVGRPRGGGPGKHGRGFILS